MTKTIHQSNWFIIYWVFFITFQIIDPLFPIDTSNRILPLAIQLILVILGVLFLFIYFIKLRSDTFGNFLIFYILYISTYAVFSENFKSISLMLMSVTPFFPAYYYSKLKRINLNFIFYTLYALVIYVIYVMMINKQHIYINYGNKFDIADNYGYLASLLSILFLINTKKTINIVFFIISIFLSFYSMKRGAILCSSTTLFLFIWNEFSKTKNYKTKVLLIISSTIGFLATNVLINQIDSRFSNFENSGREKIYTTIYNEWLSEDFVEQFFGKGYFASMKVLDGAYAHSDWFEILYDQGILGIIVYLFLLINFVRYRKKIKFYTPQFTTIFYSLLSFWIIKSAISGVVVGKDSFLLFFTIGLLFGNIDNFILARK